MRPVVEKIRRFYAELHIYTKKNIDELYTNGKLNEEEYLYILGE